MICIPNYSSSEISSSEPSEEGHQGHHEYIFVIIFFLWQCVYIPLKPQAIVFTSFQNRIKLINKFIDRLLSEFYRCEKLYILRFHKIRKKNRKTEITRKYSPLHQHRLLITFQRYLCLINTMGNE